MEDEEKLKRDRERLARDFDPYNDGFNIYRTNQRRQEAYNQCAPDVYNLMKCVDKEGPAWFWRCNALHIELQKCYEANKPKTPSLIDVYVRDWRETALARWEQAKWFVTEFLGGGGKRD